ncbi:MAG: Gfo/Idh/MocA family oxidoreductase [Acidimicrobiales bacterium]|nr:Gfo/Idh/MocA family oxidoreductase [Acidimicrobiales bacterium]
MRYGVIGTGMMGLEHIYNINAVAGGVVTAVSDPHEGSRAGGLDAARQAADAPSIIGSFSHHGELLESGLVDAVVIASPNFTHRSVLGDVLTADVHTLIEKPLCTTVEDCAAVVELASKSSKVTQVGMEYRYMPPVARLIREVKAGAIGDPRMVAIREHRFPFLEKVGAWNRFSANTGGTLVEKCCHFFDLMNEILGTKPLRVMASGGQDVNHLDESYDGRVPDVLDNAFVIIEYPDGKRAHLDLCMFAEATHNQEEMSAVGAKGKVEAFLPTSIFKSGRRGEHFVGNVDIEEIHDATVAYEGLHHGSSYLEHVDFLAACRGEREIEVTVEDGLLSVAMGVAAHRSIEEGRIVAMTEVLG